MKFLLIGNPENRRISAFVEALKSEGLENPIILSHQELIQAPELLYQYKDLDLTVRIDSVGENSEVERLLLYQGHAEAALSSAQSISPERLNLREVRYGELFCPRQYHCGYEQYLYKLQKIFDEIPHWNLLNTPAAIKELFDKRLTSQKYHQAGIPVPDSIVQINTAEKIDIEVSNSSSIDARKNSNVGISTNAIYPWNPDDLRRAMHKNYWGTVFIKLSCGSSASGLAIYSYKQGGNERMITTMMVRNGRIFNSLKMQIITGRKKIDYLISFLLNEGSIIERSIPKMRLHGDYIDCRVLMIDKEPCFTVVRQSKYPVTNLHLGGQRGDLELLMQQVGTNAWDSAMESCRNVASLHKSFQLGVDLMFERDFNQHRILESNAFGDLLPRLTKEGKSVYAYQISRLLKKYSL
ncbi:FIG00638667: hypothetical protein [hydrothermal vent metagenome]|uniref:ATP-grasp domain-containing protein n=1 Tax=hydrothermal vent metagenome TaxID=652676 RepID=A0A3B0Y9N4_9ZZZZ